MSEIVLGPAGEAAGDAAKNALKDGITSSFAKDFAKEFSYQSVKEYRKELTKHIVQRTGGELTRKQARLVADKLINAAKENHTTVLNATIKVVNGVVDVVVNVAGSAMTSPAKDKLMEEKEKKR
jgi:polyhydroxyalkanoate synthesis regulator phasin